MRLFGLIITMRITLRSGTQTDRHTTKQELENEEKYYDEKKKTHVLKVIFIVSCEFIISILNERLDRRPTDWPGRRDLVGIIPGRLCLYVL